MFTSTAENVLYKEHNLFVFMFAVENSTHVFLFVILNRPLTHPHQTLLDYLNLFLIICKAPNTVQSGTIFQIRKKLCEEYTNVRIRVI